MTLRLDSKWRDILRRAWSVRLIAVAAVLTTCEALLPLAGTAIAAGTFAALSAVTAVAALVARIVAQRDLDG